MTAPKPQLYPAAAVHNSQPIPAWQPQNQAAVAPYSSGTSGYNQQMHLASATAPEPRAAPPPAAAPVPPQAQAPPHFFMPNRAELQAAAPLAPPSSQPLPHQQPTPPAPADRSAAPTPPTGRAFYTGGSQPTVTEKTPTPLAASGGGVHTEATMRVTTPRPASAVARAASGSTSPTPQYKSTSPEPQRGSTDPPIITPGHPPPGIHKPTPSLPTIFAAAGTTPIPPPPQGHTQREEIPIVTEYDSELEERTKAHITTLVSAIERAKRHLVQHDAQCEARDAEFMRLQKQLTDVKRQSELDMEKLQRDINDKVSSLERLSRKHTRSEGYLKELQGQREGERNNEHHTSADIKIGLQEMEEEVDRLRHVELQILHSKMRHLTSIQNQINDDRSCLEIERRRVAEMAIVDNELVEKTDRLHDEESKLQRQWAELNEAMDKLETDRMTSHMEALATPLKSPMKSEEEILESSTVGGGGGRKLFSGSYCMNQSATRKQHERRMERLKAAEERMRYQPFPQFPEEDVYIAAGLPPPTPLMIEDATSCEDPFSTPLNMITKSKTHTMLSSCSGSNSVPRAHKTKRRSSHGSHSNAHGHRVATGGAPQRHKDRERDYSRSPTRDRHAYVITPTTAGGGSVEVLMNSKRRDREMERHCDQYPSSHRRDCADRQTLQMISPNTLGSYPSALTSNNQAVDNNRHERTPLLQEWLEDVPHPPPYHHQQQHHHHAPTQSSYGYSSYTQSSVPKVKLNKDKRKHKREREGKENRKNGMCTTYDMPLPSRDHHDEFQDDRMLIGWSSSPPSSPTPKIAPAWNSPAAAPPNPHHYEDGYGMAADTFTDYTMQYSNDPTSQKHPPTNYPYGYDGHTNGMMSSAHPLLQGNQPLIYSPPESARVGGGGSMCMLSPTMAYQPEMSPHHYKDMDMGDPCDMVGMDEHTHHDHIRAALDYGDEPRRRPRSSRHRSPQKTHNTSSRLQQKHQQLVRALAI